MDLLRLGALDMVAREDSRRRGRTAHEMRGAHRWAPVALLLTLCATLATWSGTALAGDKAMAESLFLAGKKLMEQGKLDEACPKFAESMRIEPAVGALLNLALCHERQGKTASAWAEYKQAATMAKAEGQMDRVEGALELASKLEPTLSRLTIEAPTPRTGMKVLRDGQEIGGGALGVAVAVDPGDHAIEASAPGHAPWSTTVTVGPKGDHQTVAVPLLQPADEPDDDGDGDGSALHYGLAAAVTGVSLVGLVLGSVFGAQASSKWDDAQTQCPEAPAYCDAAGVKLSEDAEDAATVSTVGFVLGTAALIGAVVLWITAPGTPDQASDEAATAVRVLPMVSDQAGGLWLGGSF